jgi:urease accessory protein
MTPIHRLAFAALLLAAAGPALAHEGGLAAGGFGTGFLHPILGWDHVAAMVAVGLWGAFLGAPAIWVLPVAFPLVMALGGALGVMGVPFAGGRDRHRRLGHRHRRRRRPGRAPADLGRRRHRRLLRDLPRPRPRHRDAPRGSPLAYAAGFVIATGLLHLAGIAFGLLAASRPGALAVRAMGGVIALAGLGFLTGTV